jgi:hypothetical protein
MKGKTIRTLLISATITAIILTGCNSDDKTLKTENETVTEVETAKIEETITVAETTTTEEETSTVEETTTEEETSTVDETTTESSTTTETSTSDDVATRRANYKTKYSYDYNAHYEIYSYLDEDEDGVITDEEAASLEKILNETDNNTSSSTSSSDSSTSSSSSSSSDVFVDEVTNHVDISTMDSTGYSTTGDVY